MSLRILMGTALAASAAFAPMAMAKEVKVAIIQSLTGSPAFIGRGIADGAVMAIEDINAKGLAGEGVTIQYTLDDDAGDRGQALGLIGRRAADSENIAIIGPTTGAIAPAAPAAANDLGILAYMQSNNDAVPQAGPWSFPFSQPASIATPPIADYAAQKRGVQNCAVITVLDNEAYVAMANVFMERVREHGVQAQLDGVKLSDIDFSALAVKVSQSDADCLFIATPAALGANVIMQFKQAGLDPEVQIFGLQSLASPEFLNTGGSAVEGVTVIGEWTPGGFDEPSRAFAEAYKARHGVEADNWAPQGYSTMMVFADALRRAGPDATREELRDALAGIKDVPVIVGEGVYNFTPERAATFGMGILTVKDGSFARPEDL
ncbi:ABC transporter substrate-binding protein [Paracoccus sp. AS002]|uniref:ABC transporter substrate-binding protein n=1 Tax=Paracoccus sp. AS002 TaxID=3019545 RepID=UPI0023E7EE8E|nr:ABC transporter substrate-binding protein [Paracoccus sp. AS002]MDF3904323.1 ABC transporter substrate-binding protein [Paracoccus sp. AS002]